MMATSSDTVSAASAAHCALTRSPPSRTNSVTNGSTAKIVVTPSDPLTGSYPCLYMSAPPDCDLSAPRFAELLVGYCLEGQAGQQVLVRSPSLATALLLELQRAILERG